MFASLVLAAGLTLAFGAQALQVSKDLLWVDQNPGRSLAVANERIAAMSKLAIVADDDLLDAHLLGAQAASSLGQRSQAEAHVAAILSITSKNQDPFAKAMVAAIQATRLYDLGQQEESLSSAREALRLSAGLTDDASKAYVRETAAWVLSMGASKHAEAEPHFTYALDVYQRLGNPLRTAAALAGMATIYNGLSDTKSAIKARTEAYALLSDIEAPYLKSWLSWALGQDAINDHNPEQARLRFGQSLSEAKKINDAVSVASANLGLGLAAVMRQDWTLAEAYLAMSQPVLLTKEYIPLWALGQSARARAWVGLGRPDFEPLLASARLKLEKSTDNLSKSQFLQHSAAAYLGAGQSAKAANTLIEVIEMERRLSKKVRETQLNELAVRFEVGRKDAENKALRLSNDLSEANLIAKSSSQRLLSLILALAVVSLAFAAYLLYNQVQKKKHFAALALQDFLTGAPNRRAALDVVQSMLDHYQPGLVMMIDLDFFKKVNDRFGHLAGDNVLKAFYRAAAQDSPHGETVGRLGGEEWVIVNRSLTDAALCAAEVFARVRKNLHDIAIEGLPATEKITFSMGVHRLEVGNTVEQALAAADLALYAAKNEGRDRFVVGASTVRPDSKPDDAALSDRRSTGSRSRGGAGPGPAGNAVEVRQSGPIRQRLLG